MIKETTQKTCYICKKKVLYYMYNPKSHKTKCFDCIAKEKIREEKMENETLIKITFIFVIAIFILILRPSIGQSTGLQTIHLDGNLYYVDTLNGITKDSPILCEKTINKIYDYRDINKDVYVYGNGYCSYISNYKYFYFAIFFKE